MGHYVIAIDLDATGWRRQYWYRDPVPAIMEFNKLENGQQIPDDWTAKRPK